MILRAWRGATAAAIAAALLLMAPDRARAESATAFHEIASGELKRAYHDVFAPRLMKLLPGFRTRNRVTAGSGENLDLLADGKVALGFAQLDIYAARLQADPARYGGLTVIGKLDQECVYLAYRTAGPVTTFAALAGPIEGRKAKIAVGPEGGGMSGTWAHMAALEPGLADVVVSNTGGALALNQLSLGMFDAVGWVTTPRNLDHVLLRAVLSNSDLRLLAIDSKSLEASRAGDIAVYQGETVATTDERTPKAVRTICTSAMIFAKPGANPDLVEATSQVLSLDRDEILGRPPIKK